MSVVVTNGLINEPDLKSAQEEYGEYIKIVVDLEKNILAAGGEWHADAERVLLEKGSEQKNLWGGGIDLETGQVDYISLINTRPSLNNSQEVSSLETRQDMLRIIKIVFGKYVKTG